MSNKSGKFIITWLLKKLLNWTPEQIYEKQYWWKKCANRQRRSCCVKLLKKLIKSFYNNVNANKITNNKSFWKTVKPSFTKKSIKNKKLTMLIMMKRFQKNLNLLKSLQTTLKILWKYQISNELPFFSYTLIQY